MKMYMAVRKDENNRWFIDMRFNGKRIRRVSPENTKSSALVFERELQDKLSTSTGNSVNTPKYDSYSEFVTDWLKIYVMANNRPAEQKTKRGTIRNHLIPKFGKLRLEEIGEREIEELKRDKIEEGLSPKTIKNILSVLRKSLDSAVQWGYLSRVPHFNWIRVPKKEVTVISRKTEELLLNDNTDLLWNTMIVIALKTGMRLGEMLALRWMDIDFVENIISVNGSMNVEHERALTKNGKSRVIPMSHNVRTMLEDLLSLKSKVKKELFVFDRGDGKPHSMYAAGRMIKKISKRLGIRENVHWHKLRHTFATNIAKRGISMRILQELMGHSTILMTERYSHVDMQSKHEAIQALDYTNENFGQILGRFPNVPFAQKAKHNQNVAVLSDRISSDEKTYLCAPRDSNP